MISAVVFTALRGLVDDRCYASTFKQVTDGAEWPAIRYTISSDPNASLCGSDRSVDDARVQIDVVAKTYGAMDALRAQVVLALEAVTPPCVRESEIETYDTETKTHRAILDYSFYPSSS